MCYCFNLEGNQVWMCKKSVYREVIDLRLAFFSFCLQFQSFHSLMHKWVYRSSPECTKSVQQATKMIIIMNCVSQTCEAIRSSSECRRMWYEWKWMSVSIKCQIMSDMAYRSKHDWETSTIIFVAYDRILFACSKGPTVGNVRVKIFTIILVNLRVLHVS